MNRKPAHEIKIGGVKATIWLKEGNGAARHTVNTSRSFKAGDEWKQTSSFHKSDLPKLIQALTQAQQWIALREPTVAESATA